MVTFKGNHKYHLYLKKKKKKKRRYQVDHKGFFEVNCVIIYTLE